MISSDVISGTALRSWKNGKNPLLVGIKPNSLIGFRGMGSVIDFDDNGISVGLEGPDLPSPWKLSIVFGAGASSKGKQKDGSVAVDIVTGAGVECTLVGPEPPAPSISSMPTLM